MRAPMRRNTSPAGQALGAPTGCELLRVQEYLLRERWMLISPAQ
jgi:hypothetical protein